MLGYIARSPGYAAVLVALSIRVAVPAIKHVVGQVFGLCKIFGLARDAVGPQQLTDEPLLVVIDIEHTRHVGLASFV